MRAPLYVSLFGSKWKTFLSTLCLVLLVCLNIAQQSTYPYVWSETIQEEGITRTEAPILKEDAENLIHLSQQMRKKDKGVKKKTILIWTPYFGTMKPWTKIFTRLINKKCPQSNCVLETNKMLAGEADALIFNGNDLLKKEMSFLERKPVMPPEKLRKPSQLYIFMTFEAPTHFENTLLGKYNNFFNWTMSYRRDSEVYAPYGSFSPEGSTHLETTMTSQVTKNKMALWMASHCTTHSKREKFVRELKTYIEIDIYGSCGDKKCGKQTILPNMLDQAGDEDPCDHIIGDYKFYLALENSICQDYVTEKFFRALKHGAIPIVIGGANYSAIAPPNSFIDGMAYDTVKDLADYLIEISQDETLLQKHLQWRNHYTVEIGHPYEPLVCDLCKKLHEHDPESAPNVYKDISEWHVKKYPCYSLKLP